MNKDFRVEDLFDDSKGDPLADVPSAEEVDAGRHIIGCPLEWFKLVFSVVRGKNELAVALYVYRLCIVRGNHTAIISNVRLLTELGIDRFAKYRALRRLVDAGIVKIRRRGAGSLEVTLLKKRKVKRKVATL
jgi:hypothetical protein